MIDKEEDDLRELKITKQLMWWWLTPPSLSNNNKSHLFHRLKAYNPTKITKEASKVRSTNNILSNPRCSSSHMDKLHINNQLSLNRCNNQCTSSKCHLPSKTVSTCPLTLRPSTPPRCLQLHIRVNQLNLPNPPTSTTNTPKILTCLSKLFKNLHLMAAIYAKVNMEKGQKANI